MSFAGLGDLRPVRSIPKPGAWPPPPVAPDQGPRWICGYCAGVRVGDSCEGCGASRLDGRQLRPNVQQPAPDVR